MHTQIIDLNLAHIALERVSGEDFENFVNAFYPTLAGINFIPLGGFADGGADAFLDQGIFSSEVPNHFYQTSTQEDYRQKIRNTIKRLKETDRKPGVLTYISSRIINELDRIENDLSKELGLIIKIRDRNFISSHINDNRSTISAFESYLRPYLMFLSALDKIQFIPESANVRDASVYVFLRQEIDRRKGRLNLLNSLADGLILWALEGTDPEKGIFLTENEIISKIEQTVPSTKVILKGLIPIRLQVLSKRSKSKGRNIRWHRKDNNYCIAFDIRKNIEYDNAMDESLRINVINTFKSRLSKFSDGILGTPQINLASAISLEVIQRSFEYEGLEFCHFLEYKHIDHDFTTILEHIDESILSHRVSPYDFILIKDAIIYNLRGAFYNSTPDERLLFSRYSSTYSLLFCINMEPNIIEYFENMAADFNLYVGSDILVRTLSERYLRPQDQMTRNTLNVIRSAGGRLILTGPVLTGSIPTYHHHRQLLFNLL